MEIAEVLKDYTKIVVETDEKNPITITAITNNETVVVDGYRVRLTPKYKGETRESFDDMSKRFTQNQTLFIAKEALQIFYEASDERVKLEALKILAAQL